MKKKNIPVNQFTLGKDEKKNILECLNGNWISSEGKFVNEFEKKLNCKFVQDNEVFSEKVNTLRGLHYQIENPQAKLIHVVSGAIKDVIVDVRLNSKTFGESFSVNLDYKEHKMLFIPGGFAHGYLVLKKNTIVQYKCTDYYNPNSEYGIRWNDSNLDINWGVSSPILSEKDNLLPFLKDQKMLPK